jgi:hypothetical protein
MSADTMSLPFGRLIVESAARTCSAVTAMSFSIAPELSANFANVTRKSANATPSALGARETAKWFFFQGN